MKVTRTDLYKFKKEMQRLSNDGYDVEFDLGSNMFIKRYASNLRFSITYKHGYGKSKNIATCYRDLNNDGHIAKMMQLKPILTKPTTLELDTSEYKTIPDSDNRYMINKYGDIIRNTENGYKDINVRRIANLRLGNKIARDYDVDSLVHKVFYSKEKENV